LASLAASTPGRCLGERRNFDSSNRSLRTSCWKVCQSAARFHLNRFAYHFSRQYAHWRKTVTLRLCLSSRVRCLDLHRRWSRLFIFRKNVWTKSGIDLLLPIFQNDHWCSWRRCNCIFSTCFLVLVRYSFQVTSASRMLLVEQSLHLCDLARVLELGRQVPGPLSLLDRYVLELIQIVGPEIRIVVIRNASENGA
jgi:hypothetical protein